MPPSLSQRLADRFTAHAVDLLQVEAGTRAQILEILSGAEQNIVKDLAKYNPLDPESPQFTQRRLAALLEQVQATIKSSYKEARGVNQAAMIGWAGIERDRTIDIVNSAVQVKLLTVGVPQETLKKITNSDIVDGQPAKAWWAKQASDTTARFRRTIQDAIVRNQSPAEAARRIRGTKALQYQDGFMSKSFAEAKALTRTSLLSVSNAVRHETLKQNADVLRGLEAQATLDGRTTEICIARAGGCWDFDGKPLPESPRQEPFPGAPPWHWQCRTTLIPIVKNYQDIIGSRPEQAPTITEQETTSRAIELRDELPPGARATDGQNAMRAVLNAYIKTTGKDRTLFSAKTAAGELRGVIDLDVKKTFVEIKGLSAENGLARNSLLRDAAQRALETKNKVLVYQAPEAEHASLLQNGWKKAGATSNQFALDRAGIQDLISTIDSDKSLVSATKVKELQALAPSLQASMDGQVAGALDYEGWLRGKSEAFQKQVLGEKKWQAWQDNRIALRDLIDQNQHPRTIEEMQAIMAKRKEAPIPPPPKPPTPPPAPPPPPPKPPVPPPVSPPVNPRLPGTTRRPSQPKKTAPGPTGMTEEQIQSREGIRRLGEALRARHGYGGSIGSSSRSAGDAPLSVKSFGLTTPKTAADLKKVPKWLHPLFQGKWNGVASGGEIYLSPKRSQLVRDLLKLPTAEARLAEINSNSNIQDAFKTIAHELNHTIGNYAYRSKVEIRLEEGMTEFIAQRTWTSVAEEALGLETGSIRPSTSMQVAYAPWVGDLQNTYTWVQRAGQKAGIETKRADFTQVLIDAHHTAYGSKERIEKIAKGLTEMIGQPDKAYQLGLTIRGEMEAGGDMAAAVRRVLIDDFGRAGGTNV